MVKTNRRKYSKRSYKRNSIKRKRSYKNNHRGGSFLMAHIPTIILGLMDVGAIIFLSMYDTDSSGISTGSPPQVGVQAQQQLQPGQQQLSPAQQQLSPAQQQLSPAQQQLHQGKNESKEECEKRKKELSKEIKKMKQDIDTKKSAIRRLRIDETAKKKAATAAVADAEMKAREAANAATRKEAAKVAAEGLKMANELALANAAARATAAAEEVAASRALALAKARAAATGDGRGGGSAQKRGGSVLHEHENVEQFLSEETDDEVDSPEVEKLKYELEDLVSKYNELVEEYNKDCKKSGKTKGDKESSQIDKEVLMVKATLYLMLKNGEIESESEINIKDSIIDKMFDKDRQNEILKKFNESVLIDSIFRGNVYPVKSNPLEVYKIKDPNKLFTSLGVLHGIGQLAASILNSPKNLINKIRGSSTRDSQSTHHVAVTAISEHATPADSQSTHHEAVTASSEHATPADPPSTHHEAVTASSEHATPADPQSTHHVAVTAISEHAIPAENILTISEVPTAASSGGVDEHLSGHGKAETPQKGVASALGRDRAGVAAAGQSGLPEGWRQPSHAAMHGLAAFRR